MKTYHLPSGHLVVDLCCHGSPGFFEMFNIETMLSDDFSRVIEDLWSEFSTRRYVLPLEPDKKVASLPLTWRCKYRKIRIIGMHPHKISTL